MADPLSADALVAALREEGVTLVEHRGWRTHNRNGAGPWGPVHGVMIHHTATSGTESSVELCYDGRSDLPGPLCHGVIAKDGTVHLVGHGRANHAGKGDGDVLAAVIAERALPADNEADTDGNTRFYGFECVNLGDNRDPWPAAQVEAIVRASAAICRAHGWGKAGDTSVIGHLEWQPGKIDPRGPGIGMEDVRSRVAERLRHPAGWSREAPPSGQDKEGEDPMPKWSLLSTTDYARTVRPGEWTTLNFNRAHEGGAWVSRDPQPSILVGPAYYTASVGVRVRGLAAGQEFQIRLAEYRERDDGGYERTGSLPISSPVHDAGEGHFSHTWTGFLSGSRKGRLRVEVLSNGEGEATVDWARAETLYWPA
ncbi:N-acetylmuramoyl-L-alanine amidase [Streptomyces hoynatensis]|uniref:N-acetylmuramoyl-L-alanine amidase n=1 Tax=Streptomyces hoynatensis TaxID=1141874 RepID=A0A3A9YXG7_9ACTN|nr:N-acetylmuramoyl-L-alanine amidase [Streptomyces hoynatensis]RKN40751.1 N-acetylmuramoyl-L-alanine amidase [Streptomyces hoynatensis]